VQVLEVILVTSDPTELLGLQDLRVQLEQRDRLVSMGE
jgi:hypothetical protein